MSGIVVIGAGQAGASLAAKARMLGYSAPITLIGEEPLAPYQRPPLSKGYLLGELSLERLFLRSPSFWKEHEITLALDRRVTAIDRAASTVTAGGEIVPYEHLVVATGSYARKLPQDIGGGLPGVHTIRTLADVNGLMADFRPGRKLLIIGGGYIGLEAAAVGAKLGLEVTLIEAAPRILQRVAAAETSNFFRDLHSANGVVILEGVGVNRLAGEGRVSAALLSNGITLSIDFVIVGIGVVPSTQLAAQAGLAVDNGIWTDAQGRTSDPRIWAAGECASFPYEGGRVRLESVGHSIEHSELVAGNIIGGTKAYEAKPWFWSDQYDVKLQIAGLNAGYDRVVERTIDQRSKSIWYFRGDRLVAVDAINNPRAYMIGKRIIDSRQTISADAVVDATKDVKSLLAIASLVPKAQALQRQELSLRTEAENGHAATQIEYSPTIAGGAAS
ncbi:NAD(P)/FAD-dependent oxidoreductase [Mesorhizobium atlanticum]|uniref:Pyridine nucleotide-disulfide oxidoreductase n=1 Tax=Mesorhizobium atlanticum TaxID=2233532 RepID=A0A330GJQ8_9HYPH|nr:FAD-dependent oxidoreductase [Mesorhizobium atlanticum]RAZ73018.1 pyridine nucleotide-disulfide oxidoreductase [Mesorhizobium atlanticum]